MAQYIVRARNTQYEGKAVGIRFNHGEAFVNEYTIDKKLGKPIEQVIAELSDLGYEIQEVPGDPARIAVEFRDAEGKPSFPVPEKVVAGARREYEDRLSVGSPERIQEQVDPDSLLKEREYLATLQSPVHTEAPAGARVQEQVDPDPVPYKDEETGEVVVPAAEKFSGQTINPNAESVTADGKITADEGPGAAVTRAQQTRDAALKKAAEETPSKAARNKTRGGKG